MLNVATGHAHVSTTEHAVQQVQLLSYTLHESMKRMHAHHLSESARTSRLSPRELECLQWTAIGKTAWEISQIVGITESTVSFHIRNTISKLNASNRSHAVAVAMEQSLLKRPLQ